ncbi:MAG: response regulator [Dehalococcoidia bacterium]
MKVQESELNNERIRVLLVDDDEDEYVITREVLSEIAGRKYDLEWVASYDVALQAILGNEHDVCLIDYHMGVRNGLELVREALESGSKTPMILLTGQGDREVDIEAMEVGVADYLIKGRFDSFLLERSIRYALQRRRAEEAKAKLEEQLLQSQKMEAMGNLAGGVAHDFNNLLTAIQGYTHMLLSRQSTSAADTEYLLEIAKASERAAQLTNQLLGFSRRQLVEPRLIDLNELVMNVERMLRRLIGETIEIAMLPAPGLPPIYADPVQIEQVIINLAVNARDAMPEGGKLTIETGNPAEDTADPDGQHLPVPLVVLWVSDTGVGMSEEVKAHIFEPFFTTKEVGKGTGLGLANCYGIVEQNGGRIEVDSTLGRGTTFKMYLPCADGKVFAESVGAGSELSGLAHGTETVLLVEDESQVRHMLAQILSEQGYLVLQASDGEEALRVSQLHQEKEIQLLITDMVMPRMSGTELINELSARRPTTKLLVISGYADSPLDRGTIVRSDVRFMHKPFMPAELACAVRETLDGNLPVV